METIDFKIDPTYKAQIESTVLDVPEMLFVMVDGEGAPDAPGSAETDFQRAIQVLFGIVYAIKFWDKKHPAPKNYAKFTLAPIEGLWWMKNGQDFDMAQPNDWRWTVMLRLPEFVTPDYFKQVVDEMIAVKKTDIYQQARLERFNEGFSVQIMHVGPYAQEPSTIDKMQAYIRDNGYEAIGKHHELYFGDPRRTAPEKLHTILRHPVRKV